MSRTDSIYVVLKLTEVCNLACTYCYFFEGGDDSYSRDPPYLRAELVDRIGRFLAQGAEDLDIKTVQISLHGGEPLMIGKRRFEEVCRILNRHISPSAQLRLVVQTNGTLLDEEWVNILSAYEVGIGVSLDGPRHVNDRHRVNKRGAGSYDGIVRGIEVLRNAQKRGLIPGFGVGCVVDPETNAAEIYDHFVHALGFESLTCRPPIMDWTNLNPTVVSQVKAFYQELLGAWLRDDNPEIRVQFLSFALGAMLSDRGALSSARALSNMIRAISIRSNGDLCPDDSITPKDPGFRDTGFNVDNCTLRDFMEADFWKRIDTPARGLDPDCRECRWLGICRGGPAEERYLGNQEFSSKTVYCEVRKSTFESLYRTVGAAVGYETLDQRLALARGSV